MVNVLKFLDPLSPTNRPFSGPPFNKEKISSTFHDASDDLLCSLTFLLCALCLEESTNEEQEPLISRFASSILLCITGYFKFKLNTQQKLEFPFNNFQFQTL